MFLNFYEIGTDVTADETHSDVWQTLTRREPSSALKLQKEEQWQPGILIEHSNPKMNVYDKSSPEDIRAGLQVVSRKLLPSGLLPINSEQKKDESDIGK